MGMSENLNVASSPHVRHKDTTQKVMLYVLIALLPATIFGIINFGYGALFLILVCLLFSIGSEFIFNLITKRNNTIGDCSAAVTGLLLALNLPPTVLWWQAALGSVFAIIVVKCLFGGLGQNFMNPALGGRCFLLLSFAGSMTKFVEPGGFLAPYATAVFNGNVPADCVSSATPLALLKSGQPVDTVKMLLGNTAGTIGETSVVAILLGAIFMILMGVIDLRIPASYIVTFIIFAAIFGDHSVNTFYYVTAQLCGGGLMLGAFFMATDYVTSPITPMGQYIFGIILGILTGVFRIFGGSAEGVSYAIIISNLLVPLIERFTIPRAFGIERKKKKEENK